MSTCKTLFVLSCAAVLGGCAATGPSHSNSGYGTYPAAYPSYSYGAAHGYSGRADDKIDARQRAQRETIKREYRQGDLTRQERDKLMNEQRAIEREESRYESNNRLTGGEKRELDREMDDAARNIRRQANDSQRRG